MSEEKNVTTSGESQELKRGIKGWQVSFIGLGGVIGSCYFLGVGTCVGTMGPAVLIAFAVVGVIVYGLMIAYAELLVNLPRKGSFVAYTNEFLGETLSTGMGWAFWFNWVCYVPVSYTHLDVYKRQVSGGGNRSLSPGGSDTAETGDQKNLRLF